MKKSLVALALAAASLSAQAVTAITELTYHEVNGASDRSTYWAAGVAGEVLGATVDAYAQGIRASGTGYMDNLNGFEVGLGKFYEVGSIRLNPRVAYGTMGNINNGTGNVTGRYVLLSLEGTTRLSETIGGFLSVSHMNKQNEYGVTQNNVRAGLDFTVTKAVGVRVGGSLIRGSGSTQRGLSVLTFTTF